MKDPQVKILHTMRSPEELFEYISDPANQNHHWTSQRECSEEGYTHLLPLESLSDWWKSLGHAKLEKRNISTEKVDISPILRAEVLNFYKSDLELYWESQSGYFAKMFSKSNT